MSVRDKMKPFHFVTENHKLSFDIIQIFYLSIRNLAKVNFQITTDCLKQTGTVYKIIRTFTHTLLEYIG